MLASAIATSIVGWRANIRDSQLPCTILGRASQPGRGSALMNQPLPVAEHRRMGLLLDRFGRHEVHLGLAGCDQDRLGIGSIILLVLQKRAHMLRRDQLYLLPKRFHLSHPIMCATAGFEDDRAGSLPGHKRGELLSCELFAELHRPRPQGAVNLKNTLCQVNSDHHFVQVAVLSVLWP